MERLLLLLPEITLFLGALFCIVLDLLGKEREYLALITIGALLVALEGIIAGIAILPIYGGTVLAGFIYDGISLFVKGVSIAGMMIIALLSERYMKGREYEGEYYVFLLFSTMALCFLASAYDLILLYISIEFLSISSYILVGYIKDNPRAGEASLKYFLFGVVLSATMLYGMSLLYGISGATGFASISLSLKESEVARLAFVLILAGFGFKIAIVPFHMWVPDVFEGAPTPISALLSVFPKLSAFLAFMRFLNICYPGREWIYLIAWLSVLTMTLGNLIAIQQNNIKRLLGYSTIAHAGYLLIPLALSSNYWGKFSLFFYFLPYLFANIGAFGVAIAVYLGKGKEDLEDFKGLAHRSPFSATAMTLFLLSLIGIPGTGGFVGKLFIFATAIRENMGLLAIILLLNSVVSAFYYLKVVREMFLRTDGGENLNEPFSLKLALGLCLAFTLLLMFYPQPFIALVQASISPF
ncbi:NADH-quinone oxidoreductase subunit N [bacterium]|nr:NADH-quinone oxidoreductase subunit N [bacterium]